MANGQIHFGDSFRYKEGQNDEEFSLKEGQVLVPAATVQQQQQLPHHQHQQQQQQQQEQLLQPQPQHQHHSAGIGKFCKLKK